MFSHMAVVAIETLHYVNELVELGILDLPVGTFTDPVIVTDIECVMQAYFYDTDVGADLSVLDSEIPDHVASRAGGPAREPAYDRAVPVSSPRPPSSPEGRL